MIGSYWAQPDWQRLTVHHTNYERVNGEGSFHKYSAVRPGMLSPRNGYGKIEQVKEYLKTGPKTRSEIAKLLNVKNDSGALMVVTNNIAIYEPGIYEDELPGNTRNKQIIYGLVDQYDQDLANGLIDSNGEI